MVLQWSIMLSLVVFARHLPFVSFSDSKVFASRYVGRIETTTPFYDSLHCFTNNALAFSFLMLCGFFCMYWKKTFREKGSQFYLNLILMVAFLKETVRIGYTSGTIEGLGVISSLELFLRLVSAHGVLEFFCFCWALVLTKEIGSGQYRHQFWIQYVQLIALCAIAALIEGYITPVIMSGALN
jgi:hypothetical protein